MILRPYQETGIEQIRAAFRRSKRVLYVLPCGGGKTSMFSWMAHSHIQKRNGHVLILVHRFELVEQVVDTLREVGVEPGILAGGTHHDRRRRITVGSVLTVAKRLSSITRPTLIIPDEAHHAISSTSWGKIIKFYEGVHVCGFTASPVRLSGEGLDDCFDEMVVGPSTQELIDMGYLSKVTVYAPSVLDTTGFRTRMGEFVRGDVISEIDKPKITGDAVSHYRKYAEGKQFLAFCAGVEHARHVAADFTAAGFPTTALDGNTDAGVRRKAVSDFRQRRYLGLASADLFLEGFDIKGVTGPGVECGIILRPTKSTGLWIQMCGRILRPGVGKDRAVLLDAVGNVAHHGLPTDPREWTLAGKLLDSARKEVTPASVRICLKCFGASRGTATVCGLCGAPFPIQARTISKREGELAVITPERAAEIKAQREAAREQGMSRSFDALVKLGTARNYRDPKKWAEHVWNARRAKGQR
jgi:DNA repair protein RadD